MSAKKNISVIVPVYNEESVLPCFIDSISITLNQLEDSYNFKVIFIDDGSRDKSWNIICQSSIKDMRFGGIKLSRNFGHQAALSCGYEFAPGDALISIDADLQDPPEIIPEMVRSWEEGYKIVLAVRRSRKGETKIKLLTADVYYKIMGKLANSEVVEECGDFRLLDRIAVDSLNRFTENHRYIRGLVGWLGFARKIIEYDRNPRFAGVTKYSYIKMITLAMDGIVSLSFWPLRAAYISAVLLSIPFLAYLLYNLFIYLFYNVSMVPGWPSLILAIVLFGTANLFMLGIMGEYLGRIYTEVKRRPIYLVSEFSGHGFYDKTSKDQKGMNGLQP